MRLENTLRASLAGLALLALSTGGALAAGGSWPIGTAPGTTAADCVKAGGTVVTDASGHKVCKPGKAPTDTKEPSN